MKRILLVGNGFDLAHGLLTKYEHFLYLMKNWDDIYLAYVQELKKREKDYLKENCNEDYVQQDFFTDFYEFPEETIKKYIKDVFKMSRNRLEKLGEIIEKNSWARYFCQCEAEIDQWIDFEREIYPVLDMFEFIFKAGYELDENNLVGYIYISREKVNSKMFSLCQQWNKYLYCDRDRIWIKKDFSSCNYGILKKRILNSLKEEFDEFIYAFEIYLQEFVNKRELNEINQIKQINADFIISFNYTLTEQIYMNDKTKSHHIHGNIREESSDDKNNMVLGVNERNEQSIDFIYFVKYFQRIQKHVGTLYKRTLQDYNDKRNIAMSEEYEVHIYGHSLDETDEDILKLVIGKNDLSGSIYLNPGKVVIYYYNDSDYEQKVINLIKLYGRPIVEEFIDDQRFEFVKIVNEGE